MRRAFILLGLILGGVVESRAASYYFGTCAGPGGDGTIGNPWCEIPTGESTKKSVALLADGVNSGAANPEAAPGDIAYLCDGACDGVGTFTAIHVAATVTSPPDCDSNPTFLSPRASGSNGSPVKIQPYCNGSACEDVALSGDTDADGVFDAGEPTAFFANAGGGSALADLSWWTIDGDPAATGTKHLMLYRWGGGNLFNLNCTYHGGSETGNPTDETDGVNDVVIKNVILRAIGQRMWGLGDLHATGCYAGQDGYVFRAACVGGSLLIDNVAGDHLCAMVTRFNFNPNTAADIVVEDSTFDTFYQGTNDHNFENGRIAQGIPSDGHVTYRRNTWRNYVGAIGIENHMRNVVIEDNLFDCGTTPADSCTNGYYCQSAIDVNGGDTPMCTGGSCMTDLVDIRRNRILPSKGTADGVGIQGAGIRINVNSRTGSFSHFVIENNMIARTEVAFGNSFVTGRGAIDIKSTSTGIQVLNNTLYKCAFPIAVEGAAQTLINNLVSHAGYGSGGNVALYLIGAAASSSTLTSNDFHTLSLGAALQVNGSNITCGNVSTVGTGNRCTAGNFIDVGNLSSSRWDLHIRFPNVGVIGAGSASGSATDFDGQSRPLQGSYEIGADETPFTAIDQDSQPPPGPIGTIRMRGKVLVP